MGAGLASLIDRILADPTSSKYYLNGFKRLDNDLKEFVICAAYISYLPDAFLSESLEDDRVAIRLEALEQSVTEELNFMTNIKDHVWSKLAGICGSNATTIKHKVLSGCMLGHGFLDWRVFREAKSLP